MHEARSDSAAMTAAEFRVARERLGVTEEWVARFLDVAERTVRRWSSGATPIPGFVVTLMEGAADRQDAFVDEVIAAVRANIAADSIGPDEPVWLAVYRTDEEYLEHNPEQEGTAGWHRIAMAMVADELPQVRLHYLSEERSCSPAVD